jgi:membrane fusion protein, multidrug efflux system
MVTHKFIDGPVGQFIRTAPESSHRPTSRARAISRLSGLPLAGLLLGCAALTGFSIGCEKHAEGMGPPKRPPAPVTVATAVTRDVPVYLDEIGKCAAVELVNVIPQVSGRITERHFTDGDDVKKGDLLFTIDPRPFESELAKNQATLKQNQASLALAKTEFARVENLNRTHAASQTEYDTARNTVDVDAAQVDASEALVQTARLNLEYCYIRSPVNGRTGIRMADPGNIVKANETQLVVVQRRDPIYVDFTTTERNLPSIRRNMANGPLKVLVSSPGYEGPPGEGQLIFVDTAVQPGTGTVKLRATMPNPGQRFSPGQFVNVRLVLQIKKDAVLVPGQAVQVGQDGPFLYVLKGKEEPDPNKPPMATADQRPIKPGQLQGDQIVIETGVKPGEEVIVTGQMAIGPGAKVQVLPPLAPSGPGAPAGASDESPNFQPDTKPATRPSEGAGRATGAAAAPATSPATAPSTAEGRAQS